MIEECLNAELYSISTYGSGRIKTKNKMLEQVYRDCSNCDGYNNKCHYYITRKDLSEGKEDPMDRIIDLFGG